MKSNNPEYDAQVKNFLQELEKTFPNYSDLRYFQSGNEEELHHTHLVIPNDNRALLRSSYFCEEHSNFIHFTNLNVLKSMIFHKSLWVYNLNNLNDPREYSFAANYFAMSDDRLEDAKENMFIFSMCSPDLIYKKRNFTSQFNMWRLYGNDGKGCAIEFKILNDPADWIDFYLSKVFYGDALEKQLGVLHNMEATLRLSKPSLEVDFGQLCCFHKSILFKPELEIRLLYDKRQKKGFGAREMSFRGFEILPIKVDLDKDNDKIKYLDLSLFSKIERDLPNNIVHDKTIPLIAINKITLGYMNKKHFDKVKEYIENISLKMLGYTPIIERSNLEEEYWGKQS